MFVFILTSNNFASWEGGFEAKNLKTDTYAPAILDKFLFQEIGVIKIPALFAIRIYQNLTWKTSSQVVCNFYPSCSRYGFMAIKKYGAIKGIIMEGDRYLRCHQWAEQANYPLDYEHALLSDPVEKNNKLNWILDWLNF